MGDAAQPRRSAGHSGPGVNVTKDWKLRVSVGRLCTAASSRRAVEVERSVSTIGTSVPATVTVSETAEGLRLISMVRRWPAEKQHPRAKHGLAVLKAIGTDSALLELHAIAQKVRFRGLQQLAMGFMMDIAARRGLTTAQLEDRIVPSLGLDAQGSRWLDFGPRRFRVVLGADLKPVLLDEGGKVRSSLPKPGAKDDATLARQAQEQWKLLGKQLKQVAGVQASRLEQALMAGRKWAGDEFRTYLVAHPVLGLLTRRLLWEGRDAGGRRTLFRVTEDRAAVFFW